MPTVPIEQNRVGIAGLTDAKLQPGDYSGTGLQALGAGLRTLGDTGEKVAVQQQQRRDEDDDFAVKRAWNAYAEGAREIRASPLDLDPDDGLAVRTQAYTDLRDQLRAGLETDRQRDGFDATIGQRFDHDLSGASTEADRRRGAGLQQQDGLIQHNAGRDAIDHVEQPELFARYLETGAESVRLQSVRRGDAPDVTAGLEAAFRSGVHREVIERREEEDPVAAATYYARERAGMTAPDRKAVEASLFEPLARALAARDVDGLLPVRAPGEPDSPLTLEEREAAADGIAAQDWTEARKAYARDALTGRGLREDQRRNQTASAAKEAALAALERLGPDFTSLTQLPGAIRRDLDEGTETALARQAERNFDPTPIAPQGLPALRLNLMATYQPADFARQDLRLVRDLMAPAEYDAFVRQQRALGGYPPGGDAVTQRRVGEMAGQPTLSAQALAQDGTDAAFRPIAMMQDGGSFAQDRAVALQRAEDTGRDPAEILRELKGLPTQSGAKSPASTKQAPAPSLFLNYLSGAKDDDAIRAMTKMGSPPGYVVIYSHGSPSGQITDAAHGEGKPGLRGREIFLDLIRKGYKKGTPIILTSCFAANRKEAQKLSALTKGIVYAARAFVTVPNATWQRYDLTVYARGYGVGARVGYAKFDNGVEKPSTLLGLRYDPASRKWSWRLSNTPLPIGNRVAHQKADWLTELRAG